MGPLMETGDWRGLERQKKKKCHGRSLDLFHLACTQAMMLATKDRRLAHSIQEPSAEV